MLARMQPVLSVARYARREARPAGSARFSRHPQHVIGCHLHPRGAYRVGRARFAIDGPFLGVVPAGVEDGNELVGSDEFLWCLFAWDGLHGGDGSAALLRGGDGAARLPYLRRLTDGELATAVGLLRELVALAQRHGAADRLRAGGLILELLALWASPPSGARMRSPEERYRDLIAQYALDPGVALAGLARRVGLDAGTLARRFRHAYGCAPVAWRTRLRIQHARDLLTGSSLPVKEVARLAGFADPRWFARVFRHALGMSPRACRRTAVAVAGPREPPAGPAAGRESP